MTDPGEARQTAAGLVSLLRERAPALLTVARADIGPALEQQLFIALRDDRTPPVGAVQRAAAIASSVGRLGAATAAGVGALLPVNPPSGAAHPMVVLVREHVHLRILGGIEAEVGRLSGERLAVVRVGRAASRRAQPAGSPRLGRLLDIGLVAALAGYQALVGARLARGTAGWDQAVGGVAAARMRRVAAIELPRIGLGAVGIASLVRRWRPGLLAAFDEVGTWARILPAVASAEGVPSLDLPHAEAVRAAEIRGAGYERFAVYGPRAASVLREAGIDATRIVEIGAPAFDALVAEAGGGPNTAKGHPRVVFAAQYVTGSMTPQMLATTLRGALAAADAMGSPSELVVVPHPAEPPGMIAQLAARQDVPAGVSLRIAAEPLHAALRGAAVMVTGWSNSVFEAGLLRVPVIMVEPHSGSPVTYAADGLATAVTSVTDAADVARRLREPRARDRAVERALAALEAHLGPADGRASERAARLMLEMAGRDLPNRAAA